MNSKLLNVYKRKLTICDDGTVYFENGRKASMHETYNGYLCIVVNGHNVRVHRLVAMAFLDNPNNYSEVDHLDGDRKNNNVNNLEWVTRGENVRRAAKRGSYSGERNSQCKLTEDIVRTIKERYKTGGIKQEELATQYGVSSSHISSIICGKKWAHIM